MRGVTILGKYFIGCPYNDRMLREDGNLAGKYSRMSKAELEAISRLFDVQDREKERGR